MRDKKPVPKPPRPKPSPELVKFSKRIESESTAYNWRSRENLKRGKS
jgi:hypothetical protein